MSMMQEKMYINVYGFQHKDDLEVFSLLLGVSGI